MVIWCCVLPVVKRPRPPTPHIPNPAFAPHESHQRARVDVTEGPLIECEDTGLTALDFREPSPPTYSCIREDALTVLTQLARVGWQHTHKQTPLERDFYIWHLESARRADCCLSKAVLYTATN